MPFTVSIDSAKYADDLNKLIDELGANSQLLLQEEMRLVLRDILRLTPPKTFAQGRNAVAKDLAKVYITTRGITKKLRAVAPGAAKAFIAALKRGDTAGAAQIAGGAQGQTDVRVRAYSRGGGRRGRVSAYTRKALRFKAHIPGLTPATKVADTLDPQFHIRRRTRYGRVNGNYISQIVEDAQSYKGYLKTIWDRVGFARAGFAGAYRQLGGDVPDFVSRLIGRAPGSLVEKFGGADQSITATSASSKIPGYERTVQRALYNRTASLESEVKRLLAGGKSRRGSLANTASGQPG